MSKKDLRKKYLEMRQGIGLSGRHGMLAEMQEFFREISITKGAKVLSYCAMTAKNEVDPSVFEELLASEYEAAAFAFPAVRFGTGEMEAYLDNEHLVWEEVAFGLTQPASGTLLNPLEIDVVLTPLLAFDLAGYRLGYGKGFYDRYLNRCRPDVISIGLSWFEAEQSIPEIGAHDVPLKYCVTPQRLYVF
jgi:5-formyltetrahydrofolate cyclo-ligase